MSATRGFRAPFAWLAAGLLAAFSCVAFAQDGLVPVPKLTAHAMDLTGTLTAPELAGIDGKLAAFERNKGSQVAVLMVPSIGAEPIEDFALRVTDSWKLGRKGVDDGVLFVIAKKERKVRIQTGRSVQGTLTDALSGRIIRERVTPAFRDGNFAAGIDAGVDAILKAIEGESLPPVKAGTTSRKVDTVPSGFDFLWLAFFGVPVVAMILRPMVGRAGSAVATGGITGVGAWLIFGSLLVGALGAVIAFIVALSMGTNALRQGRGGGGPWIPGGGFGGGSWGGGGGGGGFSGGGGGFDGGGASGNW